MIAVTWATGETFVAAGAYVGLLAFRIAVAVARRRRRRIAARDPLAHLRALQRLDARRAR